MSRVEVYVKHPIHGNKHVPESEVPALVKQGWVVWPRTAEQKRGVVAPPVVEDVAQVTCFEVPAEPVKRGPGRPRKVT